MSRGALCVLLSMAAICEATPAWQEWISKFGHDVYEYPPWIADQMVECKCSRTDKGSFSCLDAGEPLPAKPTELTFCVAKQYLLQRMPTFDQHYLPPAVTVHGKNMLDDNIAFALMANNASTFSQKLPLALRLAYVLPYSSFHEPRNNWRPLFFSKFYNVSSHANSTVAAMQTLLPHVFEDWSGNPPLSQDAAGVGSRDGESWKISWSSSTAPPVTGPFDFVAYGHGSCTAWSTFITYVLRSVGVPARQVGTPCWNSPLGGIDFTGLATSNPNVSKCWHGGAKQDGKMVFGNDYLNNHNWVELWDDVKAEWVHVNDPPGSNTPNEGLCSWDVSTGCDYNPNTTDYCKTFPLKEGCACGHKWDCASRDCAGSPATCSGVKLTGCERASKLGMAMRDHPIIAPSWSLVGDIAGEEIIDGNNLTLSTGESVSPLVWASQFENVLGEPLSHDGLRFVNLTSQYRCHPPRQETCGQATYCANK